MARITPCGEIDLEAPVMPESSVELGYPADAEIASIEGVPSVPAAFQSTVRHFPHAVAYRTIDDRIKLTWSQAAQQVERWAHALSAVGVGRRDTVAMMMVNRPEHLIADLGTIHIGGVSTSIYNTMPPSEFAYVAGDAGARVLVTQETFLPTVRDAVVHHGLSLDTVVVFDTDAPAPIPGTEVLTAKAFLDRGKDSRLDFQAAWQAVEREDLCHVIYTSGTTGNPKGVELSHRSALAGAEVYRIVAPVAPGRRLLSAFPLAHAAERAVTYYVPVVQGHCVTFCDDIRKLNDHYLAVRPAYVFMTPRSLERFRAMIEKKVALEPDAAKRSQMERAIAVGIEVFTAEQTGRPIAAGLRQEWEDSAAIRREILATVGLDGVEYAGCGSAPVTLDLMTFFLGLGMPAREGWGMTETGATTAIGRLNEPYRVGYCGKASPGMEIKIAGDGEVLVRGTGLMSGYRNNPEETARVFDADGWLHSGDIGVLNELEQLRMVDRKKELIINANGKNMSPVKIESKVKNAGNLIGQIIAIGDSRPYVSALVLPDTEGLAIYRHERNIPADTPLEVLAKDPDLNAAIQTQIDQANSDLADVEQIRHWKLLTEDWIPGGDELTPTMKLKRRTIVSKYADIIDELYK
ncbi:AMP-dependent synthetase/ligase [Actinomadura sp. LOL_016]|uniref:AMP-dependent synthetase/ligase n=1 Tax=unclassified Actinomadura TaxID=2626254 RepID=UPI003A7FB854